MPRFAEAGLRGRVLLAEKADIRKGAVQSHQFRIRLSLRRLGDLGGLHQDRLGFGVPVHGCQQVTLHQQ